MTRAALLLLLAPALWAGEPGAPEFTLHTADGAVHSGPLTGLGEDWSVSLGGDRPTRTSGAEVIGLRRAGTPLPALPAGEQVVLANGDRLPGRVVGMAGERLRFLARLGREQELTLPLADVVVVWFAAPAGADDPGRLLRKLAAGRRKRDTVLLRNGDVIEGVLTGLDRRSILVEVDRKEVAVDLAKAAAVALNTELARRARPEGVYAELVLAGGARLALSSARLADGALVGRARLPGVEVSAPMEDVAALALRQGRAVYLSDLEPAGFEFTPYSGEVRWPYVRDGSVAGADLVLGGSTFDKGLGLHAASRLTYDLGGGYRWFEASVGLDDRSGREGRARVQVLVDGKAQDLGGAEELTGGEPPRSVRVSVAGAQKLTLVVDFGRRGDVQAHVDWADARLIR